MSFELLPDPEDHRIRSWQTIYPTLRKCGEIARRDQNEEDVERLLKELSTQAVFGDFAARAPDASMGRDLLRRVQTLLQHCRDQLVTPVPPGKPGDEAIVCWWAHVTRGVPIKSIGHYLAGDATGVLSVIWRDPKSTARERMWTGRIMKKRTMKAIEGLGIIVDEWVREFNIDLATAPPVTAHLYLEPKQWEIRPIGGDRSDFVADVQFLDGELVEPGEQIIKTWRLRNSGVIFWHDRRLTRVGPADSDSLPRSPESVPIPETAPGEEVDITVEMIAPQRPGTYKTTWKMTDESGREYFPTHYKDGIFCIMTVVGPH